MSLRHIQQGLSKATFFLDEKTLADKIKLIIYQGSTFTNVLPFIFFPDFIGREIKNNLKKSGAALWNFSLSLKALPLSEHLAKLFSLSRRYRFRNMIDERGHIAAPALDVAAIDDALMIASSHQLLGIGQCRHIELSMAVVALAAQAGNIAIQRATVRPAGGDLFNRRHRNAAGK